MIRVTEIKFKVKEPQQESTWRKKIAHKLTLKPNEIKSYSIVKESIDARKEVVLSYTVDVEVEDEALILNRGFKASPEPYIPLSGRVDLEARDKLNKLVGRPIIIGFGPAGMFAGLLLAEAGLKPIILERGEDVVARTASIETFWSTGKLNPNSNVQFGEGGAGTFSDGKLTTRVKDERIEYVIKRFIEAGAPAEIAYKQKPHIGTDYLKEVVKNIRSNIVKMGGEIHFSETVMQLEALKDTTLKVKTAKDCYESEHVILAIGHSARDTFEMLYAKGVAMESKPFAVGMRIEHPQVLIDTNQYGDASLAEALGAAEYKLTHTCQNGRSVYSFCMCPGGEVVASASEDEHLVVNGMSCFARDLNNSNSALLVNVTPDDFGSSHPLAGIAFQRKIEHDAFHAGGGDYSAPICTVGTMLGTTETKGAERAIEESFRGLEPTYRPKVKACLPMAYLPEEIVNAIKEALPAFGRKIKGFDHPHAILTGVESRSSSPVRILRNPETLVSINTVGLYPCGEGAGYAGGITSSAIDGIKVAERIIEAILYKA